MRRMTCPSRRGTAATTTAHRFQQRCPAPKEVEAFWRPGTAAFIDVLPRPPKPANLPAGTIWRDRPRLNIPGSLWLPDTGYGALAPSTEDYLRNGLLRASA